MFSIWNVHRRMCDYFCISSVINHTDHCKFSDSYISSSPWQVRNHNIPDMHGWWPVGYRYPVWSKRRLQDSPCSLRFHQFLSSIAGVTSLHLQTLQSPRQHDPAFYTNQNSKFLTLKAGTVWMKSPTFHSPLSLSGKNSKKKWSKSNDLLDGQAGRIQRKKKIMCWEILKHSSIV